MSLNKKNSEIRKKRTKLTNSVDFLEFYGIDLSFRQKLREEVISKCKYSKWKKDYNHLFLQSKYFKPEILEPKLSPSQILSKRFHVDNLKKLNLEELRKRMNGWYLGALPQKRLEVS